jgi:hypothetical protein
MIDWTLRYIDTDIKARFAMELWLIGESMGGIDVLSLSKS